MGERILTRADFVDLLKGTAQRWSDHNAPRLGASLAYYSLLSIAPLAVLIVALFALFLNRATAENDLIAQAQELIGASGANTVRSLVESSMKAKSGTIASVLAIVTLLFGASGVFVELRDSLNTIWDVKASAGGVKSYVARRLFCFGMILALGFLLLVSLVISAAIALIKHYFISFLPVSAAVAGEALNAVISLAAITVLFALIFKFVPDARIDWRDVWVGALTTAVLFTIGRAVLAIYLTTTAVGSTYGAAGSLVALVVWVYYSAQIFFFGAIFTRVYAEQCGSRQTAGAEG